MSEDGYARYRTFFGREPLLTVEWHDAESEARGWLVINSLRGGAAGGGTRMKAGATRDEAVFLAKTMEIKFGVSGPLIGGAKSVIDFDHRDPRKHDVLARWFRAIGPYLERSYGTGGDLNVDEVKEVTPLIASTLGLAHPQEGIVRGLNGTDEASCRRILGQLKAGVELPVELPVAGGRSFPVADLITGYGVAVALRTYYERAGEPLAGKRVLVEGFGAVGGPAAYYLSEWGARVVGVVSRSRGGFRWCVDPQGLDVRALLARRQGADLPEGRAEGDDPSAFWATAADAFVPAAASHLLGRERLASLAAAGVRVIACGANTPFFKKPPERYEEIERYAEQVSRSLEDYIEIQEEADRMFAVIPDFVANSGMARTFAYLMEPDAKIEPDAIFADVEREVSEAVGRLLASGDPRSGLLERAFALWVP